jgi:hypothetical protein
MAICKRMRWGDLWIPAGSLGTLKPAGHSGAVERTRHGLQEDDPCALRLWAMVVIFRTM